MNITDPVEQLLLAVLAIAFILYLIYIIEIKEILYKKIFAKQVDKLGFFIQDRKIKNISGNIWDKDCSSPNAGWYKRGELCCKYINVELEDNNQSNDNSQNKNNQNYKTFKLFKLKTVYRNKLGYDIEIKTSKNHPNEPLVTLYVPDEDYYDRMRLQRRKNREQEKQEKLQEFIKTEYTTTYKSKEE